MPDLGDVAAQRWPVLTASLVGAGIAAVFALPVSLVGTAVGALGLFRLAPGPLPPGRLRDARVAAQLASLPVLDALAGVDLAGDGPSPVDGLASVERVEVYQATGMIIAQLDVSAAEALVRLRAHAFANGLTAGQVACAIITRDLTLRHHDALEEPCE